MRIETTDARVISIGLSAVGFSLVPDVANYDNTFFSGYLAELLDDAYFLETGAHIPEEWKEQLSGLSDVMASRRGYRLQQRAVEVDVGA